MSATLLRMTTTPSSRNNSDQAESIVWLATPCPTITLPGLHHGHSITIQTVWEIAPSSLSWR